MMRFETSNCVALGVPDRAKAVELYSGKLGFQVTGEANNWTELSSGALKLYIVQDETREPCFDLVVDDVAAAKAEMEGAGFKQEDLSPGEIFMRDPFGYLFCVSPRK